MNMLRFSRVVRPLGRSTTRPLLRCLPALRLSVRFDSGTLVIPDALKDEEFEKIVEDLKKNPQMSSEVIEERVMLRKHNKEREAFLPPAMEIPKLPTNSLEAEVCALWTKGSRYGEQSIVQVEEDMRYFFDLFNYKPSIDEFRTEYESRIQDGDYQDDEMKSFLDTNLSPGDLGYEVSQEYKARAEKMFGGEFIAPDRVDPVVQQFFASGDAGTETQLRWLEARFKPYPIDGQPSSPPQDRPIDPFQLEQVECNQAFYEYLTDAVNLGTLQHFVKDKEFYDEIMSEYRNEIQVLIESAEPLTDGQKQDLLNRAQQLAPGKTLIVKEQVDESLLAGFTLTVGDGQIDMSVARNVGKLEASLNQWVAHGSWTHERS